MQIKRFNFKEKCLLAISGTLLIISTGIQLRELFIKSDDYNIKYEYINIKDMAQAKVSNKKDTTTIIDTLLTGKNNFESITEVALPEKEKIQETILPTINNTASTMTEPRRIWYLPTEMGYITQNPNYGHVALDIGSPRGSSENIFPVANGIISGIYTDSAGAKIVTVLHNINGQKYTSQYVHLSAYASNIYVGKEVTINDSLGLMGTTGRSTGVHLHLAVLDCALFDSNDPYCSDLNGFFRYANTRLSQEYIGLGTMMNVPGSWSTR